MHVPRHVLSQRRRSICYNLQVRPRGQKGERSNGPSWQTPGLVPRNIRQISFNMWWTHLLLAIRKRWWTHLSRPGLFVSSSGNRSGLWWCGFSVKTHTSPYKCTATSCICVEIFFLVLSCVKESVYIFKQCITMNIFDGVCLHISAVYILIMSHMNDRY